MNIEESEQCLNSQETFEAIFVAGLARGRFRCKDHARHRNQDVGRCSCSMCDWMKWQYKSFVSWSCSFLSKRLSRALCVPWSKVVQLYRKGAVLVPSINNTALRCMVHCVALGANVCDTVAI